MKHKRLWFFLLVTVGLIGLLAWVGLQGASKPTTKKVTNQSVQLPKSAQLDNSDLILVNKAHPLDRDLNFKKAELNGISYNQKIEQPLTKFLNDAQKAGHPTTLVSGYRSKAYQKQVFEQNYQENLNEGMSAKQAQKETKRVIQTPGASEHATGLAVDVMADDYWNQHHSLDAQADQTKGQQWLIQHAPDYGFILRYPKDKVAQKQTGIAYESWHFRYVGVANAKYMTKHHLTLEAYRELIQAQDSKK